MVSIFFHSVEVWIDETMTTTKTELKRNGNWMNCKRNEMKFKLIKCMGRKVSIRGKFECKIARHAGRANK